MPVAEPQEAIHELFAEFVKMPVESLKYWLPKFVLEARRADGEHYLPDTLYAICSGLQRALKFNDREDVLLFNDANFSCSRGVLDSEMKRLRSLGKYRKVKSDVIGMDQEDILWRKGLLGDSNPAVLLDTLVYYIGLYFVIRGGEHRRLCYKPCQIELVEPENGVSYLIYTEFVSKTNQGGLLHRKKEPKKVVHHANLACHERCLVRLFKLYNSKCPADRPHNAFYLRPRSKSMGDIWYQKSAVGHNWLANVIPRLFMKAGISGHYTNHSLRATAATRLFDAGIDEQLIMSRTGHSSSGGVRSYKRVTEQLREKHQKFSNAKSTVVECDAKPSQLKSAQKETMEEKGSEMELGLPTEKENALSSKFLPTISFAGAANFTVNINF